MSDSLGSSSAYGARRGPRTLWSMAEARDHYQVLGVDRGAARTEIRNAHRRLVHVLHPDRHHGASEAERRLAERRMREINQAWSVLSDEARRSDYDRTLAPGPSSSNGSNGRSAPGPGRRPRSPTASASTSGATGPSPGGSRTAHVRAARRSHPGTATVSARPDDGLPWFAATILRRGPLVAVMVVALALLVLSAYAGSGAGTQSEVREVSDSAPCVLLLQGSEGRYIDCALPNDGQVLAEVEAALDCPEDTRYAIVETDFVCIPLRQG